MASDDLIPKTPSAEAYAVDEDQGDVFTSDDPFELFAIWLRLARERELNDPNAMSLATVDRDGRPDVRVVLLKDVSDAGLTFYTNRESAKGEQIAATGEAALCFHWKSIRRQVRFRGAVAEVSGAEADAYFAERARGARIGAIASDQSRPMPSADALKIRIQEIEARYADLEPPRPERWTGYRLTPREIEFWVNRPFRLHDRLLFRREAVGATWSNLRLYP